MFLVVLLVITDIAGAASESEKHVKLRQALKRVAIT